jgi:lipopolysaccharide biosynthesis regulator YciM
MHEESLLLFLFIALVIGWVIGGLTRSTRNKQQNPSSNSNNKHRLQLLFDSYSDEALDNFIHSLDVNGETLGLHISIGKHFRTEGEVEKAILIHQNLMSHPELSKLQTEPVVYELAKDYKAAGLFDRAESLLEQLLESKGFEFKSRKLLLDVYELEKDWLKAAEVGARFDYKKHPDIKVRVAQYYCELAEEAASGSVSAESLSYYKKALKTDKLCARAHLAFARASLDSGDVRATVSRLRELIANTPEFLELALPLLLECTQHSETFSQYRDYLEQLYRDTGNVNVLLAIFDAYLQEGQAEAGFEYLEQATLQQPSLSAVNALLQASSQSVSKRSERLWHVLSDVIAKIRASIPAFRCENCGFSGKQMHWLCPSCKSWQSIKPYSESSTNREHYT